MLTSLLFLNAPGTHDVSTWLHDLWVPSYQKWGLIGGYIGAEDDYPPLSFIIVAMVSQISEFSGLPILLVYKIVLFCFLTATTAIFYYFTRNPLLASLLHLSSTLCSTVLGYLDIMFAPFLVLSLFFLRERKLTLSTLCFTIASLMKYLPLVLAPLLLVYAMNVYQVKALAKGIQRISNSVILPAALATIALLVIYGPQTLVFGRQSVLSLPVSICVPLHKSYIGGFALRACGPPVQSYLSGNAMNLGYVIGFFITLLQPRAYQAVWQIETGDFPTVAFTLTIIFILVYSSVVFTFFKKKVKTFEKCLLFSALGYLAYFMFSTSIHENYLFLVSLLWILLLAEKSGYSKDTLFWLLYANLNLLLFYGITGEGLGFDKSIFGYDILPVLISTLGLAVYLRSCNKVVGRRLTSLVARFKVSD